METADLSSSNEDKKNSQEGEQWRAGCGLKLPMNRLNLYTRTVSIDTEKEEEQDRLVELSPAKFLVSQLSEKVSQDDTKP
jgi:hypothetical protein